MIIFNDNPSAANYMQGVMGYEIFFICFDPFIQNGISSFGVVKDESMLIH